MIARVTSEPKRPRAEERASTAGFTYAGWSNPTPAGSSRALNSALVAGYVVASRLANSSAAAVVCARPDARTHAAEDLQASAAATLQPDARAGLNDRMHADGDPHLRPEAEPAKTAEAAGCDARDRELGPVDADEAAHDAGIELKASAPALVTQDGEGIGALRRVRLTEEAAGRRRHAEHAEIVLGHHLAPDHIGRGRSRGAGHDDVQRHARHPGQAGEHSAVSKVLVVQVSQLVGPARPRVAGEQRHELPAAQALEWDERGGR